MTRDDEERGIGAEIASALYQFGTNAVQDVGNTYLAVLMQGTGWKRSLIDDMTQDRAQEISNNMVDDTNSIARDVERDL